MIPAIKLLSSQREGIQYFYKIATRLRCKEFIWNKSLVEFIISG